MLSVMSGVFLTAFLGSSLNIAIPEIEREFSVSAALIGWVATAYLLTNAALLLVSGWLGDRFGRMPVYLVGLVITTVTTALAAFSPSVGFLISVRAVQGIGSSLVFANSIAIISDAFSPDRRGQALGLTVAATYLGLSLGPVVGGALIHTIDWRAIFSVPVLCGIISLASSALVLKKTRPANVLPTGKVDYAGMLFSILILLFFVSGISIPGNSIASGIILICAGIIALGIFIRIEHCRSDWRLLDISLFKDNRLFSFSCLAALLNYSATFASGFLLSVWLQYTKSLASHEAGLILVAQPTIQAIFSPVFGRISDRVDKRILASAGMALTTCAIFWLAWASKGQELSAIIVGLVLSGTGFALFSSPNSNAIMSAVAPRYYGTASAILALSRTAGQLFSMGLVTAGFTLGFGTTHLGKIEPGVLASSISHLFFIMGLILVPGIVFSLLRNKGTQGLRLKTDPYSTGLSTIQYDENGTARNGRTTLCPHSFGRRPRDWR